MRLINTIVILFSILLVSCSNYSTSSTENQDDLRLADMILEEGSFTLYQEGENPIEFKAKRMAFFSAENKAEIEGISFSQKDEDGNIIIEGSADYGELDTEDELLTLEGNVSLDSIRDEMSIRSDGKLSFNTRTQEVESSSYTIVSSADGEFSSQYFYGNLLEEEYSFSSLESGRIEI